MAIATRNGSVVCDVAFALVTATSDTVLNGNEAYAFASCSHCAAVAISFQVVLIVGNAHAIAPKNVSAAVAYNCVSCLTAAIAIQLDVSLTAAPSGSTEAQLATLWKQINAFGQYITSYSLAEIRNELHQYEQQIAQVLQPLTPSGTSPPAGSSASTTTSSPSTPASLPANTSTEPGAPSTPPSQPPTTSEPSPSPASSPPDAGSSPTPPPSDTAAPTSERPSPTP